MELRAQIELMTNPQEFSRLCNAVLIAEHGDDFLPIDDDRSDRGNDGYLKREKRMFAAHCFKRAQNQSLDRLIRAKMVGDLGKAIALKRAEVWAIESWTFLSNYPVADELAAEIVHLGREAGIDVAWRGPDYFAAVLTAHPEIVEGFPGLQMTAVAQTLLDIQDALEDKRAIEAGDVEGAGVPVTAEQRAAIARSRPPGWEYLLFAGVLRQRRAELEPRWRDHELQLPARDRTYVDADDVPGFLSRSFALLRRTLEPMSRVFGDQQAAFGPPGEPGDAMRIEHFANWIMDAYADLLRWGATMRAVDVPDEFERTLELAARAVDRPLEQFREWLETVIAQIERIPAHFARPEAEQKRDPLLIEAMLLVSADTELLDEAAAELWRAVGLS